MQEQSIGERLCAAREQRGLTLVQAAQELHLDLQILEALESDDFQALGAPVFAKGHLRKYVSLLGLSVDDFIADYYRAERRPEMPPLVTPPASSARWMRPVGVALLILLLISIVAGVYWWLGRPSSSTPPAVPTLPMSTAETVAVAADPETKAEEEAASLFEEEPPPDQPARAETPEITTAAEPVTEPQDQTVVIDEAPEIALALDFRSDSWVEIYDAAGKRLFFGLGSAGTTRGVRGEPPLDVLLGNADAVVLRVGDEPFLIPTGARRGRTARFAVDAQ